MLIEHLSRRLLHKFEYEGRIFHSVNVFVLVIVDLRESKTKVTKQQRIEEEKDIPSLTHASGMITASIHG